MQDATFALFERAGYSFKIASRSYQPVVDDDTIEPILLRPQEIPGYVDQGVIDAGLTGADWIADSAATVHEVCEPAIFQADEQSDSGGPGGTPR